MYGRNTGSDGLLILMASCVCLNNLLPGKFNSCNLISIVVFLFLCVYFFNFCVTQCPERINIEPFLGPVTDN
jgi:hypothetical protein